MTREEKLKEYIIAQYGTLTSFCLTTGIPKSSLSNVLQRGLGGASVDLILKICDALRIDVGKLHKGIIEKEKMTIYDVTPFDLELLTAYHDSDYQSAINKLLNVQPELPKEIANHEENESESE